MTVKSHQLLFHNLIDINPRTGTIMLHDKRMVLMSVEALGILRRDLINTLSMERAKGFLLRYGWACGYRDGELMTGKYQWESKEDLLLSGPSLHTLEGVVTVEPDVLEIDEGHLYFTGYWRNSFEAEEHISHFDMSDETVCWMLVGYASGFLTKTFGKEVVVYEKYCKGKGDPYCYFVAQTAEDCSEEHIRDLDFYKTESLQSVLDSAYLEIKQLNEDILESEKIQDQLTELLLKDKDVNHTTELIGSVLKRSVVIDHLDEVYTSFFLRKEDEEVYHKWRNDKCSALDNVHIETFDIKSDHLRLGKLVVIGDQKLSQREEMIIKRALMVFTIQMFHQRKITESIWRKKEDFFSEIINHRDLDEVSLRRKAHIFDFNPNEPLRVITVKVSPKNMINDVLNLLIAKYSNTDIFIKNGYILLLENEVNATEQLSKDIIQLVSKKLSEVKVYLGVGRKVGCVSKLGKSYRDAVRICDFVQLTYPIDSKCAKYEELEPIILFLKGGDHEELIMFYKETIGKLVKYDQENGGNFLITLKSYLDHNGNLQQTANDLHLSIAGLRYRIEKIESICDIDLKTGSGRFNCQLAIKIFFTLKIINKEESFNRLVLE
ncbi:XylR N-terminal domain-containing protein [Bacillus shivajii]|uniref:XylR N-terminal domain-containing protein n=1 Tax=Bacillus shivajii TaxID=1983719 RepID=UPI001CF95784|nr:XylR N-terminal domain-containing protein [Bacillus shivajii]UCZ52754.1 XylR N-terminal domain-containing protein [Bacillus shivajii]